MTNFIITILCVAYVSILVLLCVTGYWPIAIGIVILSILMIMNAVRNWSIDE